MDRRRFCSVFACCLTAASAVPLSAAVTPTNLNRSRPVSSVTITATGTAATLDGNPFPLAAPTAVASFGFHELIVTDPALTPPVQTYRFIVTNPERFSSEDGLPTMKPYRLIMDAPSAFSDGVLQIMAPAVYPKGLPIPVAARLVKGPAFGDAAGDPLFLNGRVTAGQFPAHPVLLRRGWGSTILPAAAAAVSTGYHGSVNGRSAAAPIVIEDTTAWTVKSGTVAASENWGSNARIHITGNLAVSAGATITIGAGTVVRCAPGAEIRVRAGASVEIAGTAATPVVFVPDNTGNLWGGFWLQPQSGASIARLTATGTLFCAWGANQNWFTAVSGEPAKNFPHHRNQQPCVAVATGAVCTMTDCALIGPTGLNQTRGAALATNGGSLIFTRVLMQRCITGGEQEDCPVFEFDSCALLEMNEPGVDVDSDTFSDLDNDGIYLVPDGRTMNLNKTVIGWLKDDGIDTGADGPGTVNVRNGWFENCVHEAISNSGVDRVPRSYNGVHFNNGQGMECGYGAPHSLVENCAVIGNMVGVRFGDNYGNNSGSNGTSGTSLFNGDITARGSLLLYNYFHDAWAIDFSRWNYSNERLILTGSRITNAADLAAQSGPEDTGSALWNPAADAPLLAPFMPVPGSDVGVDFPVGKRQDTLAAWPGTFNVRLSTFSSNTVSATWRVAGKPSPDVAAETEIAAGTLTWLPGETLKTFSVPVPAAGAFGLVTVTLGSPVKAEVTGGPLWYFPAPAADVPLVAKASAGWSYFSGLPPGGWTVAAPWPPLAASGHSWAQTEFAESADWKLNRSAPLGWGTITAASGNLAFGTSITERPVTVYARKTFTVADPDLIQAIKVECMADDGAAVYINGTRVSPASWGLPSEGAIFYNRLSDRFQANGVNESTYDSVTLNRPGLPILLPAPALNVLAVEVHQQTVDSSDCSLDAALTAQFASPSAGIWGISPSGLLYWTDPSWVLETATDLTAWTPRPDLTSPVPVIGDIRRVFYRLKFP